MDIPVSTACGHTLDRIDHVAIEHLILDQEVYRGLSIDEGLDDRVGLGSEVRLVCGYCLVEVPREQREFFYAHWWQVVQAVEQLRGEQP